jgi:hypothetical protein
MVTVCAVVVVASVSSLLILCITPDSRPLPCWVVRVYGTVGLGLHMYVYIGTEEEKVNRVRHDLTIIYKTVHADCACRCITSVLPRMECLFQVRW